MRRDRQSSEVIHNGIVILWWEGNPADVPPFVMNGNCVPGQRSVGSKAFHLQDVSIREQLRIGPAVRIRGEGIVMNPFGEEQISQEIADPSFGMAKADFAGPTSRPLLQCPTFLAESDSGIGKIGERP